MGDDYLIFTHASHQPKLKPAPDMVAGRSGWGKREAGVEGRKGREADAALWCKEAVLWSKAGRFFSLPLSIGLLAGSPAPGWSPVAAPASSFSLALVASTPVITMAPPSPRPAPRQQKRCRLEADAIRWALSQLEVRELSATCVLSTVMDLDDDVLRPDAREPRVLVLVRKHLDAAVQRAAAAAGSVTAPPGGCVDASVDVLQIAYALALALQWQGLLWDALAVLEEEPVLLASAALLSMIPPSAPASACPRCDCGVEYAEDDFDAPACQCFPPLPRELQWLQELDRMREELQRRIGTLEEQVHSFAAAFSSS